MNNISLTFVGRKILDDVSWHVRDDERVGIVGANGSGKTTLLKVIAGLQEPDSGNIEAPKNCRFGYLPQQVYEALTQTVWDEAMHVFADVIELKHEMEHLEHEIASRGGAIVDGDPLLDRYSFCQHRFEQLDGFEVEAKVGAVLMGLGFAKDDFPRSSSEFSGGWQMRIALAKLLLQRPDVLLLDEPTNYLDLEARQWLEQYLVDYDGTVVIVSHDRYFLDKMVTSLVEVGFGKLAHYRCNYTEYEKERAERHELLLKRYKHQEEHVAHVQTFIDRFRYKARKASAVQSRIKYLDRLTRIEIPPKLGTFRFDFPQPERGGKDVARLTGVQKSYGDNTVFDGLDLMLRRRERVAVVGVNGAGKTTLLKIIAGAEPIDSGEIKLGYNIKFEYFSQEHETDLSLESTVLEEMESVAPIEMVPRLRGILGNFLFSGDDVLKKVKVLSGGERSRLVLAKMMFRRANFLVLDEPTNHLDIAGKQIFEDAIQRFEGTVLIVSHDRRLMNNMATRVLEVREGHVTSYLGNYNDYLYRESHLSAEDDIADSAASGPDGSSAKEVRIRMAPHPKSREGKKLKQQTNLDRTRLSQEIERIKSQIEAVEEEIEEAEAQIEKLDAQIPHSETERTAPKFRDARVKRRKLGKQLKRLYHRWESLSKEQSDLKEALAKLGE
ncbi:MAG TPA: ABC-F family ATP-binding cassette domain-containing protein [bacterium]|nr:ABC-F family ATP-binding cassette domain-containing protein [bacterium]